MRVRKGAARTKANRRLFKAAEGYVGGRRKLLRTVKETLERAGAFAFRDRRARKRDFRRLWIPRRSKLRGLSSLARRRGGSRTFRRGSAPSRKKTSRRQESGLMKSRARLKPRLQRRSSELALPAQRRKKGHNSIRRCRASACA